MKKWFRFTIRDWFWFSLLVACFAWYAQRYSRLETERAYHQEKLQLARKYGKQISKLEEERRLLVEELTAKNEAAIDRELELKTTVRALKLRLGEDPYGK